jgi:hypothetical protein
MKIAIIGAGPSGLTLSTLYTKHRENLQDFENLQIDLYEQYSKVGGCHAVYNNPYFSEHSPKLYNTNYLNTFDMLSSVGIDTEKEFVKTGDLTNYGDSLLGSVDYDMIKNFVKWMLGFSTDYRLSTKHRGSLSKFLYLIEHVNLDNWTYSRLFDILEYNWNAKTLQPVGDFCQKWVDYLGQKGVNIYTDTKLPLERVSEYDKVYFCGPAKDYYTYLQKSIPESVSNQVYFKSYGFTLVYRIEDISTPVKKWQDLSGLENFGIVYLGRTNPNSPFVYLSCNSRYIDSPEKVGRILESFGFPKIYSFEVAEAEYSGNTNFVKHSPCIDGIKLVNHINGNSIYPYNTIESNIQNCINMFYTENKELSRIYKCKSVIKLSTVISVFLLILMLLLLFANIPKSIPKTPKD